MIYWWKSDEFKALKAQLGSTRLANIIVRNGCKTFAEFCARFNTKEMMRLPNFGPHSLGEVRALAIKFKVPLRDEVQPIETIIPLEGRITAKRDEFVNDWNAMIAFVADFSTKWDMPKPEMIFHPRVHAALNYAARTRILGTLIHMDVKVRFGRFEQASVLREG